MYTSKDGNIPHDLRLKTKEKAVGDNIFQENVIQETFVRTGYLGALITEDFIPGIAEPRLVIVGLKRYRIAQRSLLRGTSHSLPSTLWYFGNQISILVQAMVPGVLTW